MDPKLLLFVIVFAVSTGSASNPTCSDSCACSLFTTTKFNTTENTARTAHPDRASRVFHSLIPSGQPAIMDPKLLLFVIVFAISTASASNPTCSDVCADYYEYNINEAYSVYDVNITAYNHLLYGDAYKSTDLPDYQRKLLCHLKLNRLIFAYKAVAGEVTKRDFGLFCQNVTEIIDCYNLSDLTNRHRHSTLLGVSEDFYICGQPIFAVANRMCRLGYERAMQIEKCFNAATKYYTNSDPEELCRQICCHQCPAIYPGPLLCAPEKNVYEAWIRPCCTAKVDETFQGNACMKVCMMKYYAKYAETCAPGAVCAFEYYGWLMRFKFLHLPFCFQKCPNFMLTGLL